MIYMAKFLFVEEVQVLIDKFWKHIESSGEIPTVEGLCSILGLNRNTLSDYERKESFSSTIKNCKNNIFNMQKQLAMQGKINASVFIFNAKNNYGYVDRIETVNKNVSVVLEAKEATDIIENILQEREELPIKELNKQLPSASEPTATISDNTTTPIPKPKK